MVDAVYRARFLVDLRSPCGAVDPGEGCDPTQTKTLAWVAFPWRLTSTPFAISIGEEADHLALSHTDRAA